MSDVASVKDPMRIKDAKDYTAKGGFIIVDSEDGGTGKFHIDDLKRMVSVDDTVTADSDNPVSSKAVYTAIGDVESILKTI